MNKTLIATLAMVFVASGIQSNQVIAQVIESETSKQTPLLDRELFFGNPQIAGGQLSPDGKFISFMKPYQSIMNVWVKEFAEPFENARPLTDSKRP